MSEDTCSKVCLKITGHKISKLLMYNVPDGYSGSLVARLNLEKTFFLNNFLQLFLTI